MDPEALRAKVLAEVAAAGFALAAIAPADPQVAARKAALDALASGHLEGMAWITADWLARATAPDRFLPGARSVILVALPYRRPPPRVPAADGPTRGRIAAYAAGRDYHRVFEKRLRRLARAIRVELGASARPTVDYGPLLERPLASTAGLGWRGKSTMLLVPGLGPWVLLGAVATDLDLRPDEPLKKRCGACTRCIAACPTGALSPDGMRLDARLCISYHTIENRRPIPRELRPLFGDWVFGCDDCLIACPVGAQSTAGGPELAPAETDADRPVLRDLLALDEAAFVARFRGRAIMRAKRDGLVRNACVALGNVGTAADVPALLAALDDDSPLVRGHAAWALGRLAGRGVCDDALRALLESKLAAGADRDGDAAVREECRLAFAEANGHESSAAAGPWPEAELHR